MSDSIIDLFEYFVAMIPLTIAHLVIPPLSTFRVQTKNTTEEIDQPPPEIALLIKFIRTIFPPIFQDPNFVYHLILEKVNNIDIFLKNPERLFNSHLFTHLFVHYNYQHLFTNLTTLLSVGEPLYSGQGRIFFYSIFFFGGAMASLPIWQLLRFKSNHQNSSTTNHQSDTSIWTNNTSIKDLLHGGVKKIFSSLSSYLQIEMKNLAFGSSGAVCAILGGSTVVTMRRFFLSVRKICNLMRQDFSVSRTKSEFLHELMNSFNSFVTLSYTFEFVRSQIANHQKQLAQQPTIFFPWTGFFTNQTIIDYEAHLQGFVVGAMATLVAYDWQYLRKRFF